MSRTMTARLTATTARTTGEDDDDSKDDDSKDDSNDGKDDSNDGRNGNSIGNGGGEIGGDVSGEVGAWWVARSVVCLVAVFFAWRLHTVGIVQTCFGINLFWSKLVKKIFGTSGQVQYNSFYLYLFQVYSMFILV